MQAWEVCTCFKWYLQILERNDSTKRAMFWFSQKNWLGLSNDQVDPICPHRNMPLILSALMYTKNATISGILLSFFCLRLQGKSKGLLETFSGVSLTKQIFISPFLWCIVYCIKQPEVLVLIWFPCLVLSSLSHQHHGEHRCGLFQQSCLKQCMCCLICWWVCLPEELVSIQTLCGVNFISASFSHWGGFIFKDRTFSSWISLSLNSSCSPS